MIDPGVVTTAIKALPVWKVARRRSSGKNHVCSLTFADVGLDGETGVTKTGRCRPFTLRYFVTDTNKYSTTTSVVMSASSVPCRICAKIDTRERLLPAPGWAAGH